MTSAVPRDWVTVTDIAIWMDVHENTVYRWIKDGDLVAFKHKNIVRVREQALVEFIVEHSTV